MEIKITFPGGKKVLADLGDSKIMTDQPVKYGGEGSAPTPYALFMASIGTCAGIYVLSFCQERKIPAEGVSISQRLEYSAVEGGASRLDKVVIEINVPPGFPEKYHGAIAKVADQCAVKKTILSPPAFEVFVKVS